MLIRVILEPYVDPCFSLSLCAKMTSWFNYWGHMCLIFELLGDNDDDDDGDDDDGDKLVGNGDDDDVNDNLNRSLRL